WSGDVAIFFVNLFNCFTTALLGVVFFAFSLRLGQSVRTALTVSLLLGLTSYVAPFSTGFFQHSSEALFLLWAFYFLFLDAQHPNWRTRALGGCAVGLMLLFRFPSFVSLPVLGIYVLWSLLRRRPPGAPIYRYLPTVAGQLVYFIAPIAVAL